MAESRVTTVVEVLSAGGVPNARGSPGWLPRSSHGLEALTAGGTVRKPIVVVVGG